MVSLPQNRGFGALEEMGEQLRADVIQLARESDAPKKIWRTLESAMEAMRSERQPQEGSNRFTYEVVPDHIARIAATRLASEIIGIMPKKAALSITNTSNNLTVSVEQQVAEFESIGGTRDELLKLIGEKLGAPNPGPTTDVQATPVSEGPAGGF